MQPLPLILNTKPVTQPKLRLIPSQTNIQQPNIPQAQNDQPQIAEVNGVITSVDFAKRKGDPTTFKINCPNIGKTFPATCDFFCPLRQGDTIYALCIIGADGRLYLNRPPFVQPALDKDSVIQCFMRSLKQGYGPTMKMYNSISSNAGGDDAVIPYLTGLAQSWNDTHNSDILMLFRGIDSDNIKKLLSWWHRERNLRRLYLFGLTKKEINACRMKCEDIYQKCMTNPYTIPAIPLEKCDGILDRLNKRPDQNDRLRGAIIRVLWNNLVERGWIGTPTRMLAKQFPTIKEHVEILKKDYGLVTELETAYLVFPHRVETWLAEHIANKRLADPINYDTPLDEQITLPNGVVIERMSAHFTKELSPDQQKSIQGALDHNYSVVTGGAGTGKCLHPDTDILMFDGSIKKIKDIAVNELVMGPDSLPRTVLSVCSGTDNMFEIVPKAGRSFICNTPHVLTLKGIDPYFTTKSVQFIVNYSIKGEMQMKIFDTKDEANNYMKALPEDIFDIPLDIYLQQSPEFKKRCYIFHQHIDFPEQYIPDDPFTRGQQIMIYDRIPPNYLINTYEIRNNLLAGIFDTYAIKAINGEYRVCASNSQLVDDIKYLGFSLGYMITSYNNNIITISETIKNRFAVNSLGPGEYCGFELDKDGRFLLGDFTVTHNTTCLGQLIHNLDIRGLSYAVCSFTGKAVARIREVTGKRNPSTIHRLISNSKKNQLDKRPSQFEKDIPLHDYEHIIIDEGSMLTEELYYDLMQAYPNTKKITLFGDANQLSPIGWGTLFQQILKSNTIPTYRLTTNYRVYTANGERDGIILNANAIINHDPTYPFEFTQTDNFTIIEGSIERVYDIIKGCFTSGIKAEKLSVISPYNRNLATINKTFQGIYDLGSPSVTDSRGVRWMIGDRVMLLENDAEIGVFNGESGTIRDMTPIAILVDFGQSGCHEFLLEPTNENKNFVDQAMTGSYGYRGGTAEAVVDGDEGDFSDERTVKKLMHAYAITADKSQGSEWDFVIVYIDEFNLGSFLNKNRIYTAITRTKRACWCVVTDTQGFEAAAVKSPGYRCDNLSRRLEAKLPNMLPFTITPPIAHLEMSGDLPVIPEEFADNGFDCDDF